MTVQTLIEILQQLVSEGYATAEVRGEHYAIEEAVVSPQDNKVILY